MHLYNRKKEIVNCICSISSCEKNIMKKNEIKKDKIVKIAMDLFIKNGYEATSIMEICDKCHISKGSFYYHFQSKIDILNEYFKSSEEHKDDLAKVLLELNDPRDQLWEIFNFSTILSKEIPSSLARVFYQADIEKGFQYFNPFYSSKDIKYKEVCIKVIQRGQRYGTIKKGKPEDMFFAFLSAQFGIALSWAFSTGKYNEEKALKRVFETIF